MEYIQQKLLPTEILFFSQDYHRMEQLRTGLGDSCETAERHKSLAAPEASSAPPSSAQDWVPSAHLWTLLYNYGLPASRLSLSLSLSLSNVSVLLLLLRFII